MDQNEGISGVRISRVTVVSVTETLNKYVCCPFLALQWTIEIGIDNY